MFMFNLPQGMAPYLHGATSAVCCHAAMIEVGEFTARMPCQESCDLDVARKFLAQTGSLAPTKEAGYFFQHC